MNTFFTHGPMKRRDSRLKEAQNNAERCQRYLRRDRFELERQERIVLDKIKALALKGDLGRAKMLAQQAAQYRAVADRNFAGSVMIETRAQLMVSNHKINRAEVEAIKGIRYANIEESRQTVYERQQKYAEKLAEAEDMEELMNEGMDDIYEEAESSRARPPFFAQTIDAELREALDPQLHRRRVYVQLPTDCQPGLKNWVRLHFRRYTRAAAIASLENQSFASSPVIPTVRLESEPDPNSATTLRVPESPRHGPVPLRIQIENQNQNQQHYRPSRPPSQSPRRTNDRPVPADATTLFVENLDLSADMVKRELTKDPFAVQQLGLSFPRPSQRSRSPSRSRSRSRSPSHNPNYLHPHSPHIQPQPQTHYHHQRTSGSVSGGGFNNIDSMVGTPTKRFRLGRVVDEGRGVMFVPFDFTVSLKACGVKANDIVWVDIEGDE
ncbi:hypothetical protein HK102_001055 [Quaeritorhiza haematococci]|nr:hypothetical protein HK102_001055 [Quaeritorhiza haematococci]